MKKFSLLLFFLLCVGVVSAQKMTDDQVIEYVMAAQEKGDSQQQIAKDLLRRGIRLTVEKFLILPILIPFGFDVCWIVFCVHSI